MDSNVTAEQMMQHLREQITLHRRLAKEAADKLQAIESVLADPAFDQELSRANAAISEAKSLVDSGALKDLQVNLNGARNLAERVIRVAQATKDGVVNATEVTRFLIDSGVHQSSVKDMRPNVFRVFDEHPDVFEKVSPGYWRLISRSQPVQENFLPDQ